MDIWDSSYWTAFQIFWFALLFVGTIWLVHDIAKKRRATMVQVTALKPRKKRKMAKKLPLRTKPVAIISQDKTGRKRNQFGQFA